MADPRVPQPTELIHLPEPSLRPLAVAAGLALLAVGLYAMTVVAIVGAAALVFGIAGWISDSRDAVSRLPRAR